MRELLGGEALTIDGQLTSKNNRSFKLRMLIDSSANGYAFINCKLARKLRKTKDAEFVRHRIADLPICGFDGRPCKLVNRALKANLEIDHYVIKVAFLETSIGSTDIILGRQWLAKNDILMDCKRRRL